MRHGSLFSGIGGFDLASEWMGWENIFQVEWDSYCQKVLAKNFPKVKRYGDIKEFDGTQYRGLIDIISGGFPCQPYSLAGKQRGKADDRHLWPEMLRTIREIHPLWVVGENVSGLINWNGGMVFNEVQTDLEIEGYEVIPFVLPACGVNAPHKRERVWFIAKNTLQDGRGSYEWEKESCIGKFRDIGTGNNERVQTYHAEIKINPDADSYGLQGNLTKSQTQRDFNGFITPSAWKDYSFESPICRTTDGIPNRMDRIKGLGNAIVPQVAYQIFKAINETNK